MQARLFIIFGVCGLIVQTLLLRVLLSWFNESRVLVIGESLQPPLCIMCQQRARFSLLLSCCWDVQLADLSASGE